MYPSASFSATDDKSFVGQGNFDGVADLNTGNALIPRARISYRVHYRLSTLMGDPLTNFAVQWKLLSLGVVASGGQGDGRVTLSGSEARRLFPRQVDALALTLNGVASVSAPRAAASYRMDFDTGASVRQDKVSWSVAGGPNWTALLMDNLSSCDGGYATGLGGGAPGFRNFVDASTARQVFLGRQVTLSAQALCRRNTGIENLDDLARAMRASCEKGKRGAAWCPPAKAEKEKAAKPGSLLDREAEMPQVKQRLARERARYQEESKAVCQQRMQNIDACFEKIGCVARLPAGVTVAQCEGVRSPPVKGFYLYAPSCSSDCRRRVDASVEAEHQQDLQVWNAKYGDLYRSCGKYRDSKSTIQECRKKNQAQCNPGGFAKLDDCVADRMKSAPTEDDARKSLEADWQRKAKTPSQNTPHNFLD